MGRDPRSSQGFGSVHLFFFSLSLSLSLLVLFIIYLFFIENFRSVMIERVAIDQCNNRPHDECRT